MQAKQVASFLKRALPQYWPIHPKYSAESVPPRVVYIMAMPRTGSTVAKRYLGDHPGLLVAPNRRHHHAWRLAKRAGAGRIVIDKRTNNLAKVKRIYLEYGNRVRFLGVVRDPRDQLVSLLETDRHMEVPRSEEFWNNWATKYRQLIDFGNDRSSASPNVALVRYEDLVLDPVGIKHRFLRWLGLDTQVGELSSSYDNVRQEIATQLDVTEDWKTHQNRLVHRNSVGRWRTITDPQHVRMIGHYSRLENVVRLMQSLGYESDVKPFEGQLDGIHVLAARQRQGVGLDESAAGR